MVSRMSRKNCDINEDYGGQILQVRMLRSQINDADSDHKIIVIFISAAY